MGITGPVLRLVVEEGVDKAIAYFEELAEGLMQYLLLLGCKHPYDLRKVLLIISGATRNYLDCRGYDVAALCKGRNR